MASYGHVFLIPSDGSSTASQGQATPMWRGGTSGENGKDLFSLMASLGLSDDCKEQLPLRNSASGTAQPMAALGCESTNKGKRGEVIRGRRLPNVEQLLMSHEPVTHQPRDTLFGQILQPRQSAIQQMGRRQEGQHFGQLPVKCSPQATTTRHNHPDSPSTMKSSGHGHQGEKPSPTRSSSVLADSHLALQTALVTMLHLQEQGDLQRKPVFPKRNLMCLSFLRLGACPNRVTCNYAHNLTELQKKLELRKTSLCKYWLKGKCENEDCNFAHGEHELQSTVGVFKTTICKYWRQGCCYSGEFCRHAHGEADLRPENLPPHLERKKQQQQQARIVARNSGQRKERAGGCDDEGLGESFDRLRQTSDAAFGCLRHVFCDEILSESQTSVPVPSLTLLAEAQSAKLWDTQGSNSSDRSTDILLSSASESPRGLPTRSGTSISSASIWSLSPEHSFSQVVGGINQGCALPRSAAAGSRNYNEQTLEAQPRLDIQHGSHGLPTSLSGIQNNTTSPAPPGLEGIGPLRRRGTEHSHGQLGGQPCGVDDGAEVNELPGSERNTRRLSFQPPAAQSEGRTTWSTPW